MPLSSSSQPTSRAGSSASRSVVVMDFEASRRPPSPALAAAVVFVLGLAGFGYSLSRDVLVGQIAAPLMTLGAIHGLWRGAFRKVLMIAAFVAGAMVLVADPFLAGPVVGWMGGQPDGLVAGLLTVILLLLIWAGLGVAVGRFRNRYVSRRNLPRLLDRGLGGLVGGAEGGLVVLALCWAATMFRPAAVNIRDHPDTAPGSYPYAVATTLLRLADEAESDPLGRLVRATNLLERSETLKDLIADLNTTGAIDLDRLDPATVDRVNALIPELTKGQYRNLAELLEALRGTAGRCPPLEE